MSVALGSVGAAIGELVAFEPLFVPTGQKRELLRGLLAAEAQLAAVRLKVLAVAGDVAAESGAKDVASWLVGDQPADPRAVRADARLGASLEQRWLATGAALGAGAISLAQAHVIASVLEEVAAELDAVHLAAAEERLLAEAKVLDPARLRRLGRHLADVVDPESAAQREAKRLAEEERHAALKSRLWLRRLGDGTTRISGRLPDATAAKLERFLEAFAQPRKQALATDGRTMPYPRLLARALGDLMDHIDPEALPDHGGDATTVIITMSLDQLRSGLGAAGLGFDQEESAISATQARRLACQAHLIPMVLGGQGQVLDAGRRSRLHTPMQRKVIRMRDKHCQAAGCTVKAEWCEVHHLVPWSHGGHTTVADGTLLCGHHHHRIHDPDHLHQRLPDGSFRFTRRT